MLQDRYGLERIGRLRKEQRNGATNLGERVNILGGIPRRLGQNLLRFHAVRCVATIIDTSTKVPMRTLVCALTSKRRRYLRPGLFIDRREMSVFKKFEACRAEPSSLWASMTLVASSSALTKASEGLSGCLLTVNGR